MRSRSLLGLSIFALLAGPVSAADQPLIYVQGGPWSQQRYDYYWQDQGSRIMPIAWLKALKQPNGQPFLDSLARYGYLSDPGNSNGLPVGFTLHDSDIGQIAGMTCAACHTRQITVKDNVYRIDGGPAFADYQGFVLGLDDAVRQVLATDAAFDAFAVAVLNTPKPDPGVRNKLKTDVTKWSHRHHALVMGALPPSQPAWGPGRLDAVGMIFNRLTGLDLGLEIDDFVISDNIKPADAPARYPFLWNAAVQDRTQWPGFARNGSDILGLLRNVGEVFGVFGEFQPVQGLLSTDYTKNSLNFDGLNKLEQLVRQIPPPAWPWPIDPALAARGKKVYQRSMDKGGCAECHWIDPITPGTPRFPGVQTWATPIQKVGTDTRELGYWPVPEPGSKGRMANSGALQGSWIPTVTKDRLQLNDTAFNILATSVAGAIIEHYISLSKTGAAASQPTSARTLDVPESLRDQLKDLEDAFAAPTTQSGYESRVLMGIWAAAPYLHNGSVPTLVELLKPAEQRVSEFKVGPEYDPVTVGLAVAQPQSNYTLKTTADCGNPKALNSGNSRCGHEFGTQLSEQEKKELLEFLKTL
jgi:processive rubber oxygenase RoxA-like protein